MIFVKNGYSVFNPVWSRFGRVVVSDGQNVVNEVSRLNQSGLEGTGSLPVGVGAASHFSTERNNNSEKFCSGPKIGLSAKPIVVTACIIDMLAVFLPGIFIFQFSPTDTAPVIFQLLIYGALYGTILPIVFKCAGLYQIASIMESGASTRRKILLYTFGAGFSLLVIVLHPIFSINFSLVWPTIWVLLVAFCVFTCRIAFQSVLDWAATRGVVGRNIVVVGVSTQAAKFLGQLANKEFQFSRLIGVFDDRVDGARVDLSMLSCPILGDTDGLLRFARSNHIDDIVIALPWTADARIVELVKKLKVLPVNVKLALDLVAYDFLPAGDCLSDNLPTLTVVKKPLSDWRYVYKVLQDRILSVLFLFVLAPLFVFIAIAIKMESSGPIFFRQPREGFNNKTITIWKFRTMYHDQSDFLANKLAVKNDRRVTRIGRFLRKSSLDELPQLFNVLSGEMSIVGPRPHASQAKAAGRFYGDVVDGYTSRHRVKPGITGWAQVNGWRGSTDTEEQIERRVQHDLYYIENWSILFDVKIIALTVLETFRARNAY